MFISLHNVIEIDCLSIRQNEIDFCVRYSLRLDQVFYTLIPIIDWIRKSSLLLVFRQEVIEICIEAKECGIQDQNKAALMGAKVRRCIGVGPSRSIVLR